MVTVHCSMADTMHFLKVLLRSPTKVTAPAPFPPQFLFLAVHLGTPQWLPKGLAGVPLLGREQTLCSLRQIIHFCRFSSPGGTKG